MKKATKGRKLRKKGWGRKGGRPTPKHFLETGGRGNEVCVLKRKKPLRGKGKKKKFWSFRRGPAEKRTEECFLNKNNGRGKGRNGTKRTQWLRENPLRKD